MKQSNSTGIDSLVRQISAVQNVLQSVAAHAVNLSLTARNWLVGFYIVEYEQHGEDRAQYGDNLLEAVAKRLNRKGLGERRLYEFRQFYCVYPNMGESVVTFLQLPGNNGILRLPTAIFQSADIEQVKKWRLPTAKLDEWQTPPDRLFYKLSATHLIYLSNIKEDLKRAFYEQEAIRGCWTVKELDRQVSSLYYERMGVSKDKLRI